MPHLLNTENMQTCQDYFRVIQQQKLHLLKTEKQPDCIGLAPCFVEALRMMRKQYLTGEVLMYVLVLCACNVFPCAVHAIGLCICTGSNCRASHTHADVLKAAVMSDRADGRLALTVMCCPCVSNHVKCGCGALWSAATACIANQTECPVVHFSHQLKYSQSPCLLFACNLHTSPSAT